jgi:hypothetical protein
MTLFGHLYPPPLQMQQHNDSPADLTPSRYKNFLVDTPLIPVPPPPAAAAAAAPASAGATVASQAAAGATAPGAAAAAAAAAGGMPRCGYGSFHQQYWLDGKLVAVGVVDVLPRWEAWPLHITTGAAWSCAFGRVGVLCICVHCAAWLVAVGVEDVLPR